ncbi:MAG TPA: exodeoxyribonuclease VII small subunit [Candidatus Ruthenibacterium avium]|uniref:Exodeoxyribonuclease 7 small subunit n=1 Tax=Candidatus Ruthenibacterium avium TaxID=2838751 RepID=A0A9D2M390_9FIRM|nr:exodeoxyribonuclease VII small subunit [Candidatus Ruthenibacterium avium]
MKRGTTFEQAAAELEALLDTMAKEETGLEESIKLYAKAAEYIAYCDDLLKKAQLKVQEIEAGGVFEQSTADF